MDSFIIIYLSVTHNQYYHYFLVQRFNVYLYFTERLLQMVIEFKAMNSLALIWNILNLKSMRLKLNWRSLKELCLTYTMLTSKWKKWVCYLIWVWLELDLG